jgi:pimeloyl-ACP methyl ester carboxylesterase
MSRKNYRYVILISSVLLLSLMLSACGGKEAPITVSASAQAGDLVDMQPCTYKAGSVEYAAECGTLVVLENRSEPGSRLIALPVIRIRATGSNPTEPIFRLAGGPGISNVVGFSVVSWFIENHDIVLVGYRGLDGTIRLDCPEVVQTIRGGAQDDMLSDAALAESSAAYARCAERLQNEGIDLEGYTVTELIDDIEAARMGLGYERINLLSNSFSTNVARIYAAMYPESIYRSAMIAVDTPSATIHEAQVVDELIQNYADLCAQNAECSARTDDLTETMRTVSQDMPQRWLLLPINPGLVKVGTFNFFESTTEAPKIIDTWLAAAEGDPSGMALFSLLGPRMFANASVWGHNAALRASLGQYDLTRDYRVELNPPDSIMGSPASTAAYAGYTAWPANTIPEEYRKLQPSDVETLLVSGNIDSDTPLQFARDELLPTLSNGQHVVLLEFGHGEFLSLQPKAAEHLLTSFYDTGNADDSLFTYHPVDFSVSTLSSYPNLAKLLMVVPVLVIVLVAALIWFIIRRMRHRRAENGAQQE